MVELSLFQLIEALKRMGNQILFGAVLVVIAACLGWHQQRTNRHWDDASQPLQDALSEAERQYLSQRRRRRMLTSVMIGMVGCVIAAGVLIRDERQSLFFWCSVLMLTLGIVTLGVADLLGTRRHLQAVFAAQRRAADRMRRELEEEVAALRARGRTPPPESSTASPEGPTP
ncbi:MAG: hypothetical protein U0939_20805 [Pirellulales bacterium]